MGNSISDNNASQKAAVERFYRPSAENSVCDDGDDFFGSVVHDCTSRFDEGPASICHIIDNDGDPILNVPDKHHSRYLVGSRTFFMNEGELKIETVGHGSSPLGTSCIRANNHTVGDI